MDPASEHRSYAPGHLAFGVLTVSSSRALADDASGRRIRELVLAAGHSCPEHRVEVDDVAAIRAAAQDLLGRGIDVLVVSGGTGLSPSDVTPEALVPLFDRSLPGFGELFRSLSFQQIGAAAMLSRATAGLVGGQAIFALPGSPKAVALAMEQLILPEAGHLLGQARRRQ